METMKKSLSVIKKYQFLILGILFMSFINCTAVQQENSLKIAIVQMDVKEGNLLLNMEQAETYIREAALQKVDMVCLPEAADFGWLYQQARCEALPVPGKYTDHLSLLARQLGIWICAGCLEKDGEKTYNAAVIIDRNGKIVLKHRKINTLPFLTSALYDAGNKDDIKVVDTEFGKIGLTICADNFDINNTMKVAELGAWLLIAPHGFAASAEDLYDNSNLYVNHIKNMAFQSKLWVVGPNTCLSTVGGGEWKGFLHSGCSTIANPAGKAAVIGKFNEPDLIIYEIKRSSSLR
jgi:predicted amidohydrolase